MLAYLQMRGKRVVRTGDLAGPLGLTPEQERKLLSRMARGGLIARVRRELYLVPSRLPLGGSWSPDEALSLATLLEDKQGQYQICGPNAFNRYGFDSQVPTRVYAYNRGELAQLTGRRNPYPHRLGVIEEGAYADILIVDGNPLEDLSAIGASEKWFDAEPRDEGIETMRVIMKDGKIYKNTLD